MAYYLKYRSRKLKELDLKSVRDALTEIVLSENIPHAFLFSGPKGTGKTSAARIIAKVINCENRKKSSVEPCNKCEQCKLIDSGGNIDVIELDAASNRGIDDIRTLRDAVKLSPAQAKSKVYVIDEAHMLTTEASNALLKTLEEPPEHVYFILATTNSEKLIGTIRSRTTEIKFRKAEPEELLRSLKRVVKGEKIKVEDEALMMIAKAAG
jgi:DNA polymerase-3 subunit gamma/tau